MRTPGYSGDQCEGSYGFSCWALFEILVLQATSSNHAVLVGATAANVDGPCNLTVWRNKVGFRSSLFHMTYFVYPIFK